MTSSSTERTETGEPTSYEHMEQALCQAASAAGEETKESIHGREMFNSENQALNRYPKQGCSIVEDGTGNASFYTSSTEGGNSKSGANHSGNQTVEDEVPGMTVEARELRFCIKKDRGAIEEIPLSINIESKIALEDSSRKDQYSRSAPVVNEGHEATLDSSPPPALIYTEVSGNEPIVPLDSCLASQAGSPGKGKAVMTLRRGKWTVEEEAYVARVIQDFNSGFLNAPAGTTLRSYLSDKLQCDPMRITKKFTGDACIGKRVFHPAVRSAANAVAIDKAQAELVALERRWRRRLDMQQRESAKKAAASSAAPHVSPGGRVSGTIQGVPIAVLSSTGVQEPSTGVQQAGQTVVTQAASWLDRANAILNGTKVSETVSNQTGTCTSLLPPGQSFDSMPNAEIESQMKEVQRLIYEGPLIQQTTASLPTLLGYGGSEPSRDQAASTSLTSRSETNPDTEPADKRLRTTALSGAEDAEALVGFLRSVRASAAAGQDL